MGKRLEIFLAHVDYFNSNDLFEPFELFIYRLEGDLLDLPKCSASDIDSVCEDYVKGQSFLFKSTLLEFRLKMSTAKIAAL
jgi:hypothetical protein